METQLIIDPATFSELKAVMGAEFMIELIDTYNLETGQLIEKLNLALAADDAATFGRLAHSIKSSSASLGALGFSQQARELELLGKANDLNGTASKVERLAVDFQKVKSCLEELRNEP